jgi:hypothetical protein
MEHGQIENTKEKRNIWEEEKQDQKISIGWILFHYLCKLASLLFIGWYVCSFQLEVWQNELWTLELIELWSQIQKYHLPHTFSLNSSSSCKMHTCIIITSSSLTTH